MAAGAAIRFAIGQCSLGAILVAQSQRGICAILLGEEPEPLLRELQDQFPRAQLLGGDADFERLVAQVVGFVESPQLGLDLPLDVRGTAFQERVWQALREIPPGSTASYAQIAERIGAPRAVRAVAQACAANRIAVAIPATGWYVATATFPATAGAWSASANCCAGKSGIEPKARRYAARNAKAHSMVGSMQWGAGPSAGSSIHVRGENFVK